MDSSLISDNDNDRKAMTQPLVDKLGEAPSIEEPKKLFKGKVAIQTGNPFTRFFFNWSYPFVKVSKKLIPSLYDDSSIAI